MAGFTNAFLSCPAHAEVTHSNLREGFVYEIPVTLRYGQAQQFQVGPTAWNLDSVTLRVGADPNAGPRAIRSMTRFTVIKMTLREAS